MYIPEASEFEEVEAERDKMRQALADIAFEISGREDALDCDEGCACIPNVEMKIGRILDRFDDLFER